MDTWILRMCRKACVRQLFAWSVVPFLGIVVAALNIRYITNFVSGPYPVSAAELEQISDVETAPHYFVRVVGTQLIGTGLQEITVRKRGGREVGRHVSAEYYGLLVGNRYLIVKTSTKPSTTIEGALGRAPVGLYGQLLPSQDRENLAAYLYPFYLETAGFRYPGYWAIAIALALLIGFMKYGRPAWIRLQDLSKHPVARRVETWGDPVTISADVEDEYQGKVRFRGGNTVLTDKYLIEKGSLTFNLLRFEDLLWAYKRVTKKSINFIPTGKDYHAVMIFYGGAAEVQVSEAGAEEILSFAATRTPWAVLGYTKELENLFDKETNAFCAAVEARRQEWAKNLRERY